MAKVWNVEEREALAKDIKDWVANNAKRYSNGAYAAKDRFRLDSGLGGTEYADIINVNTSEDSMASVKACNAAEKTLIAYGVRKGEAVPAAAEVETPYTRVAAAAKQWIEINSKKYADISGTYAALRRQTGLGANQLQGVLKGTSRHDSDYQAVQNVLIESGVLPESSPRFVPLPPVVANPNQKTVDGIEAWIKARMEAFGHEDYKAAQAFRKRTAISTDELRRIRNGTANQTLYTAAQKALDKLSDSKGAEATPFAAGVTKGRRPAGGLPAQYRLSLVENGDVVALSEEAKALQLRISGMLNDPFISEKDRGNGLRITNQLQTLSDTLPALQHSFPSRGHAAKALKQTEERAAELLFNLSTRWECAKQDGTAARLYADTLAFAERACASLQDVRVVSTSVSSRA